MSPHRQLGSHPGGVFLLTVGPGIAYLVTGNAEQPVQTQLLSENSGMAAVLGTFVPLRETRDKERPWRNSALTAERKSSEKAFTRTTTSFAVRSVSTLIMRRSFSSWTRKSETISDGSGRIKHTGASRKRPPRFRFWEPGGGLALAGRTPIRVYRLGRSGR